MWNLNQRRRALKTAVSAAQAVGVLLRRNQNSAKKINSEIQHDIKLELDVRSQQLIERTLRQAFPEVAVLGEEGTTGDLNAEARWVVDPIDGTVNFTHGIPHVCISIALQIRSTTRWAVEGYESVVAVVYDPFCDEMWTAIRGQKARLNGRVISVSDRSQLKQSILAMGFAKQGYTLERMLPVFNTMVHKVRKIRLMGAAALAMVYVACGRFDIYAEYGVRLWDVAAGSLIIEEAGGDSGVKPLDGEYAIQLKANNGRLGRKFEAAMRK